MGAWSEYDERFEGADEMIERVIAHTLDTCSYNRLPVCSVSTREVSRHVDQIDVQLDRKTDGPAFHNDDTGRKRRDQQAVRAG